jgi:hypothetical protein
MNERIKELELEAIAYADSKVPVNDRYNDIYHSIVRNKFAELIVKECADYVDSAISDGGVDGRSLKEHFGVE